MRTFYFTAVVTIFLLFSSSVFPRLFSAIADWPGCLTYFDTWYGLSANLDCRSEMCCTRLAENTGRRITQKQPSGAHHIFQHVSGLGFVTAQTSLNWGQPHLARFLAVSWAGTLYIHFGGSYPLTKFCQAQNSLCVQVLRYPILAALLRDSEQWAPAKHCGMVSSRDRAAIPFHVGQSNCLVMVALCNRADHIYFHAVVCSFSSFFPRLISAAVDWMSTILPQMVRP